MKKLLVLLLALTLGVGTVYIVGCSDDKGDTATGPVAGDTTAPEFQLMQSIIDEGIVDYDWGLINLSLILTDFIPDKGDSHNPYKSLQANQFDTLIFDYSYDNFWHIFDVRAVAIEENAAFVFDGIDSLRFNNDAGPMQAPDLTTNLLNIRVHTAADIISAESEVSSWTDAMFDIAGIPGVEMYINGMSGDSVDIFLNSEEDSITCEAELALTQTATNLYLDSTAFATEDGCPQGGTLNIAAFVDIGCIGPDDEFGLTGNWTITYTFDNGMVTVRYSNGSTYWQITTPCGDE